MELMAAVRALHLLALALLAGGLAFPLLVVRAPLAPAFGAWLARMRAWSAAFALVTWIAWLLPVAAGMSGMPLSEAWHASVLELVLLQTRFGHVWLVRLALLLCLAGVARGTSWVAIALTAAVLVTQAASGHAIVGPWSHVAVDAVHLIAAALWIGCLPPLLRALAGARGGDAASLGLACRAARGFTGLGLAVVGALAVTGFVNAQMMVGSVQALFDTGYGRLLVAKLVLLAGMLALAGFNRFWFTPALAGGEPQAGVAARAFWRSVAVETALGVGIFAIVGVLGGSEPAAHAPEAGMPMHHR